MILGLSGYSGSGKDAIADRLVTRWGWRRTAFADPLRRILERVDPIVGYDCRIEDDFCLSEELALGGWDAAKKNPEVRRLLQALGDACREELWANVFVRRVRELFHDDTDWGWSINPRHNWVIADVRKQNEARFLREYNALFVRVIRPGVGPVNDHSSETELDGYDFDGEFLNAGTLEDLHRWVDHRVESGVWG